MVKKQLHPGEDLTDLYDIGQDFRDGSCGRVIFTNDGHEMTVGALP